MEYQWGRTNECRSTKVACDLCGEKFDDKNELENHKVVYHLNYKCKECSFKAHSVIIIEEHVKSEHTSSHIKCNSCDEDFSNEEQLEKHKSSSHVTFKCNECTFTAQKKQDKEEHIKREHSPTLVKCELCEETFRNQEQLQTHKSSSHIAIKCTKCTFTAQNKDKIEEHVRNEHSNAIVPNEEFKCDKCTFKCNLSVDLLLHHERYHAKETTQITVEKEYMDKILAE